MTYMVLILMFWLFLSISMGALVTGNVLVSMWCMGLCMMLQIEIIVSQAVTWYNSGLGKKNG